MRYHIVPTYPLDLPSPLCSDARAKTKPCGHGAKFAEGQTECNLLRHRAEVAAAAAAEGRAADLAEGRAERDALPRCAKEAKEAAAEDPELREEVEAAPAKGRAAAESDVQALASRSRGSMRSLSTGPWQGRKCCRRRRVRGRWRPSASRPRQDTPP